MRDVGRVLSAAALLVIAGCTGSDGAAPPRPRTDSTTPLPPTTAPAVPGVPDELTDAYACRGGFVCARLEVPLDRDEPAGEPLRLQVALELTPEAPRGPLVVLNGGPGAAAAPLTGELAERFGPEVVAAYRLVVVDTRGTGPTALHCAGLQEEAGRRLAPTPRTVAACADALGAVRGAYGTDATVADLDRLREVLGAETLTLFGMSYGTFVAQQYAVAHPRRTRALVLDSPIPVGGSDTLGLDTVRATARVLRDACRAGGCPGDPVADLAAVVRQGGGADLLELLAAMSSADPTYATLLPALRQAARGDRGELDRVLDAYRGGFGTTAEVFSAALNLAAGCGDQRFPWGRSDAPAAGREAAVRRAVVDAGALAPFDAPAVRGGSQVVACAAWPPVPPSRVRLGGVRLPDVPALFLVGDRDLSTPVAPARAAAASAPGGRLVVVRGAGHVVTARPGRGRRAVQDFLLR